MTQIENIYGVDIVNNIAEENCNVYFIKNNSGEGVITDYKIYDGVHVCYNDMHLSYCKTKKDGIKESSLINIIEINHCREGRYECELKDNNYVYMEPGDLAINIMSNHPVVSNFPIAHYHGISIHINLLELENTSPMFFDDDNIDILRIKKKLCPDNKLFIKRSTQSIEHIFLELYKVPDKFKHQYLKVKILELLLFLSFVEIDSADKEKIYFIKDNVDKVKKIHELITSNLESHYTIDELSEKYQIPTTTLKNCFKGIYGQPIFTYTRTYRMEEAARLLKTTELSIAQVAQQVGYSNSGKFSTAFKESMNILPSNYKKTCPNGEEQSK